MNCTYSTTSLQILLKKLIGYTVKNFSSVYCWKIWYCTLLENWSVCTVETFWLNFPEIFDKSHCNGTFRIFCHVNEHLLNKSVDNLNLSFIIHWKVMKIRNNLENFPWILNLLKMQLNSILNIHDFIEKSIEFENIGRISTSNREIYRNFHLNLNYWFDVRFYNEN